MGLALHGLSVARDLGRMRCDAQRDPAVALLAVGNDDRVVAVELLHGDHVVVDTGDLRHREDAPLPAREPATALAARARVAVWQLRIEMI